VHSHSLQNQVNAPLAESERREYEDEINRLKYEKSLLLTDLQKQNQQQYAMNWQMQSLEDRLMQMEQRQKSMVASLCDMLQRNGVVSGPLLEADHFSKKRRVPKIGFFADDAGVEERQVPFLQTTETPSMFPAHPVNAEPFDDRMEMSLVSLEKFIQRASDASPEDLFTSSAAPSPVVALGEVQSAPMETNIDVPPSTGPLAHPSTGFNEPSCYAQSPVVQLPDLHELAPWTAEVDMNSDTTTADTSQDEATTETGGSHEPAVVNDFFWERFLTETPNYCHAGEADSGRQGGDCKREPTDTTEDLKVAVDCSCLHHRDRVDQITEQMGQLASAENADATPSALNS
jgi:heat shock transcription factor, other eukaryote